MIGQRSGTLIFLDTHVAIFIYQKELHKFNVQILDLIDKNQVFISPITALEMKYLLDIKRIDEHPDKVIRNLKQEIDLRVDTSSFFEIAKTAYDLTWTRDPFDRLIVANAKHHKAKLVTKDEKILENYKEAVW